ncbi:MAG: M28 family peptidase [Bacteroidaceae bacterium]|nr:M28 family peptidase [Bacteroidaceae bacterium]
MLHKAYALLLAFLLISCGSSSNNETTAAAKPAGDSSQQQGSAPQVVAQQAIVPQFDADSAYNFVARQVAFGPRVPGTSTHRKCGDYLVDKLRSYGAEVVTQEVDLKAYNGDLLKSRNIIARFQPEKEKRVMLCAHWDTRPWADSDPNKANHYKPLPGANDGGSGVGVLLEIARQLAGVPTTVGVDIILFDAEDYGLHENDVEKYASVTNSWALGSQYWSRNPHEFAYSPKYGILLDIVGAPDSKFMQEGFSMHYAPAVVRKVWKHAKNAGYSSYFVDEEGGTITDDHLYVNNAAGIPCIDIINCDPESPNGFGPYHHTMKDDMDWIDKETLKAVGQTVLYVIYSEK